MVTERFFHFPNKQKINNIMSEKPILIKCYAPQNLTTTCHLAGITEYLDYENGYDGSDQFDN